jgi:RimJ/RimL family protein N-acetyltransferase
MNENVAIRVIDVSDFNLLKQIELDTSNRKYTDLKEELNEEILYSFIVSNHDVYLHKQLKFTIIENDDKVGFLDIYDVDFNKNCAGIGIFVLPEFRRKQIASSAIELGINWCKNIGIRHFLVEIEKTNDCSIHLFQKAKFNLVGQNEHYIFLEKFT